LSNGGGWQEEKKETSLDYREVQRKEDAGEVSLLKQGEGLVKMDQIKGRCPTYPSAFSKGENAKKASATAEVGLRQTVTPRLSAGNNETNETTRGAIPSKRGNSLCGGMGAFALKLLVSLFTFSPFEQWEGSLWM